MRLAREPASEITNNLEIVTKILWGTSGKIDERNNLHCLDYIIGVCVNLFRKNFSQRHIEFDRGEPSFRCCSVVYIRSARLVDHSLKSGLLLTGKMDVLK